MGISETEVPALDTTIMGMIGQIVDLVNNGKVKAVTRTVTKVTTTIIGPRSYGKNQYSQHGRKGQNRGYRQYDNYPKQNGNNGRQPQSYGGNGQRQCQYSNPNPTFCQTYLTLSPRMVSPLMLEGIRFFKTPAQKSNCTDFSVNRHIS